MGGGKALITETIRISPAFLFVLSIAVMGIFAARSGSCSSSDKFSISPRFGVSCVAAVLEPTADYMSRKSTRPNGTEITSRNQILWFSEVRTLGRSF